LRLFREELEAAMSGGMKFLEEEVNCCTCENVIFVGDALEANGFIFCSCCWLGLDRLGNSRFDNPVEIHAIYAVTAPLLPGENLDSEQISVNIAAETQAIEAETTAIAEETQAIAEETQAIAEEPHAIAEETQAIAEETHGIDTVSQVTNTDPLAVDSNITDITEAMEHDPPGDLCVDEWTGPDTDGTDFLGDPDSIMDDAVSDPYAATDDSGTFPDGTVPDDTMHNHEQAPRPSLPPISEMFACPLPPFREVRAVVPMGCLHVVLKHGGKGGSKRGPHNVLLGIAITEQGNTTNFDLNDPSPRLPWCAVPLLELETGDKKRIKALLSHFRTNWVTRTQADPIALEKLCELTLLIGGKCYEFGGRRYFSNDPLLEMPPNTDTGSTIVTGTLGIIESACKHYPELNNIRDVIVRHVRLAVVNTKMQQAEAKKDPTIFCEFNSTNPNRKVYFVVIGNKPCQ